MNLIGHNGGPSVTPGKSWRVHCWRKARADLLPHLPLEVIRLRLRRAAAIGLDYPTYAAIRAASGHDLVALLFSTNALRLLRDHDRIAPDRAAKLTAQRDIARQLAVLPPLGVADTLDRLADAGAAFGHGWPAPRLTQTWGSIGAQVRAELGLAGHRADNVLMIGDNGFERLWAEAGRMAGYLPADRFFGALPGG